MADDADVRPGLKLGTTVSHFARVWNYWLGGKDNYAVDREARDNAAQRVAPQSRIVYADNDPLVLAPVSALLTSSCDYVDEFCGGVRRPHPPSTPARP